MGMHGKKLEACRVCGGRELQTLLDLGVQHLTGRFPVGRAEQIPQGPLVLVRCSNEVDCGLVQLGHEYDLQEMYGETYGYRSGLNKSMVAHLGSKVDDIMAFADLKTNDVVLDIGSNDGTGLGHYPRSMGLQLIGIDPSAKKFGEYYREDVEKIADFFSADLFKARHPNKKAKVITSFSMFYDLERPVKFCQDIYQVLDDEGFWCFEQSYLPEMLNANSFDTICHEHLEYYSLTQVVKILKRAKLKVVDVAFNNINGGSFSVTAVKDSCSRPTSGTVGDVLDRERAASLESDEPFMQFQQRIDNECGKLRDFISRARGLGKSVCGLGASTKGNVLLQYLNMTEQDLDCIAEVNPDKFGHFTPGTHIPIKDQRQVLESQPDYLLVLPWHFRDFFINSPELSGQTLIFPLPEFEVITV